MLKIDDLKKLIGTMKEVEFAYLFGSYAKGTQTPYSDVDIALYLKERCNTFDTKLKVHHKLEITLHKEIDVVILNNAKNFNLLEDIFRLGVILKDTEDDSRMMFELRKEHEILDYKEFKRMLDVA